MQIEFYQLEIFKLDIVSKKCNKDEETIKKKFVETLKYIQLGL